MILSELKHRTREPHERIEARLPLLREDLSLAEYQALLGRFYGFYLPVEHRLGEVDGWDAVGLDFAVRRKAPLLRADLGALGLPERALAALPVCDNLPALGTLPRALGCMYVLEGATLGGQIITRHLDRSLGLGRERGCAFFGSYGDRVGPMWKAFGAALTTYAAAHPVGDQIVHAACETFTRLDEWLLTRRA